MAATAFTDYGFYDGAYKDAMGECTIPPGAFLKWAIKASNHVRIHTFGNIDETKNIQDEVQMCVCELAEYLYACNERDKKMDSTILGEKDGSWSATYKDRRTVESEDSAKVISIIREWLADTGLMYCGV